MIQAIRNLSTAIRLYGFWGGLKQHERWQRRKIHPRMPPGPGDETSTLYGWFADRVEDRITCIRYPHKINSIPLTNEAIHWCIEHYKDKYIYYRANYGLNRNEWRFKTKKIATHFKMVWG